MFRVVKCGKKYFSQKKVDGCWGTMGSSSNHIFFTEEWKYNTVHGHRSLKAAIKACREPEVVWESDNGCD